MFSILVNFGLKACLVLLLLNFVVCLIPYWIRKPLFGLMGSCFKIISNKVSETYGSILDDNKLAKETDEKNLISTKANVKVKPKSKDMNKDLETREYLAIRKEYNNLRELSKDKRITFRKLG